MEITKLRPAEIYKIVKDKIYKLSKGDYFILLSRDWNKDVKKDLWTVGIYWQFGKAKKWGGARQFEWLTDEDILEVSEYVGYLPEMIEKLKEENSK